MFSEKESLSHFTKLIECANRNGTDQSDEAMSAALNQLVLLQAQAALWDSWQKNILDVTVRDGRIIFSFPLQELASK